MAKKDLNILLPTKMLKKLDDCDKKYMEIKFNSDDDLGNNRTL